MAYWVKRPGRQPPWPSTSSPWSPTPGSRLRSAPRCGYYTTTRVFTSVPCAAIPTRAGFKKNFPSATIQRIPTGLVCFSTPIAVVSMRWASWSLLPGCRWTSSLGPTATTTAGTPSGKALPLLPLKVGLRNLKSPTPRCGSRKRTFRPGISTSPGRYGAFRKRASGTRSIRLLRGSSTSLGSWRGYRVSVRPSVCRRRPLSRAMHRITATRPPARPTPRGNPSTGAWTSSTVSTTRLRWT